MSALPWMKFNTNDWFGSIKLRGVSLTARGLWIEMLCIMHAAEPYGHLMAGGRPITMKKLSAMVGTSEDEVRMAFDELAAEGIVTFDAKGVARSDRMIKDEAKRILAANNGKKGGNPSIGNGSGNSGGVNPTPDMTLEDWDNHTLGAPLEGEVKPRALPAHATPAPKRAEGRGQSEESIPSSFHSDGEQAWNAIMSLEAEGKRAWDASMFVLMDQGGKSDSQARKLIGAYRRDLDPADAELLEAAQAVRANGTGDPASLLRKTLQGIVERRGTKPKPEPEHDPFAPPPMPTDPEWVAIYRKKMQNWIEDRNDWPTARGPQPDQPFTRHVPAEIMAEFGYGPLAKPKTNGATPPAEADHIPDWS